MDIAEVLAEIERTLNAEPAPDAEALRDIQATLDNAAFIPTFSEYVRSRNDPDSKLAALNRLVAMARRCATLSAARRNQVLNLRIGAAAGGAGVVSSIIAVASAAIPGLFVITAAAGAWVAFTCLKHTGRLTEEEQLYLDISGRMKDIWGKTNGE